MEDRDTRIPTFGDLAFLDFANLSFHVLAGLVSRTDYTMSVEGDFQHSEI